jgi:hypothetical protein
VYAAAYQMSEIARWRHLKRSCTEAALVMRVQVGQWISEVCEQSTKRLVPPSVLLLIMRWRTLLEKL